MNKAERKKLDMEIKLLRNTNFKKGEPDGFDRCFATGLFALMDVTNYKTSGITKVWNKMQTIHETIVALQHSYQTIYDTMYDDFAIIVDDAHLTQAEQFIQKYSEDKSQKQRVTNLKEAIALYQETKVFLTEFEPITQYNDPIKDMKLNAAYEAYKLGIAAGFFRFIGMLLYAVSKTTNYKRPGLMRIYTRILDVDKAIEDNTCDLDDELLYYAIYEETDIICDNEFVPLAQAYAEEYSSTNTKKGYHQQAVDLLNAYYQN